MRPAQADAALPLQAAHSPDSCKGRPGLLGVSCLQVSTQTKTRSHYFVNDASIDFGWKSFVNVSVCATFVVCETNTTEDFFGGP